VFDPRATELIAVVLIGKSVPSTALAKKLISGVGLSLLAVTKI